jgi:hypothetical protein
MIVVENARNKIGQELLISVTSSLQTSAGKMIFGKFEGYVQDDRSSSRRGQYNRPRRPGSSQNNKAPLRQK